MVKRFEKTSDYYDGADKEKDPEIMKASSIDQNDLDFFEADDYYSDNEDVEMFNLSPLEEQTKKFFKPQPNDFEDDPELEHYLRDVEDDPELEHYLRDDEDDEEEELAILFDTPTKVPEFLLEHPDEPNSPSTPPPVKFRDNGKYKKPIKKSNRKRKI